MEHNETGCEAPDRPILCINNCGFFGRAATRNMCSKCHKEAVLKEQQADIAASSIKNIVKGSSTKTKDTLLHATASAINIKPESSETKAANAQVSTDSSSVQPPEAKKGGPSRCTACNKRVGLTGFECKCGNMFCAAHRSSDKHDCPFDYRAAAQSSIAKANPIIKPVKLHKI